MVQVAGGELAEVRAGIEYFGYGLESGVGKWGWRAELERGLQ